MKKCARNIFGGLLGAGIAFVICLAAFSSVLAVKDALAFDYTVTFSAISETEGKRIHKYTFKSEDLADVLLDIVYKDRKKRLPIGGCISTMVNNKTCTIRINEPVKIKVTDENN